MPFSVLLFLFAPSLSVRGACRRRWLCPVGAFCDILINRSFREVDTAVVNELHIGNQAIEPCLIQRFHADSQNLSGVFSRNQILHNSTSFREHTVHRAEKSRFSFIMLFIFAPTFQCANYMLSGLLYICPLGDQEVITKAAVAVSTEILVNLIRVLPHDFVRWNIVKGTRAFRTKANLHFLAVAIHRQFVSSLSRCRRFTSSSGRSREREKIKPYSDFLNFFRIVFSFRHIAVGLFPVFSLISRCE